MPPSAPICNTFVGIVAFLNKNHVLFTYLSNIVRNGGGQLFTSYNVNGINVFIIDYPSMGMKIETRKAMEEEYYKLVNRYGGHASSRVVCVSSAWVLEYSLKGVREPDPSRRYGPHRLFREDLFTSSYLFGTTRQQQFEHQKAIVKHQLAALDHMVGVGSHAPSIGGDSVGSQGNDDNTGDEPSGSGGADASQVHHGRYCSARASTKSLRSVGGTSTSGGSTGPGSGRINTRFHPYGKQRTPLPTSAVSGTPELESHDGSASPQELAWPALSQNRSRRLVQTSSSRALGPSPTLLNTPRSDSDDRLRPSRALLQAPTHTSDGRGELAFPPPSQKRGPLLHRPSTSSSGSSCDTRSPTSVAGPAPSAPPHALGPCGTWIFSADPTEPLDDPIPSAQSVSDEAPHGLGPCGTVLDTPAQAPEPSLSSSRSLTPAPTTNSHIFGHASIASMRPFQFHGDVGLVLAPRSVPAVTPTASALDVRGSRSLRWPTSSVPQVTRNDSGSRFPPNTSGHTAHILVPESPPTASASNSLSYSRSHASVWTTVPDSQPHE